MKDSERRQYVALLASALAAPLARGWEITEEPGGIWIQLDHESTSVATPTFQGWKLHVAAHVWSARPVLRKVLPVLLRYTASFKVAASPRVLSDLNDGLLGHTQIGKFITVYPADDSQATALAARLNEVTHGMDAPRISSDRPLHVGSIVNYRYGSFRNLSTLASVNEPCPALIGPDGSVILDRPTMVYRPPVWAIDPFQNADVAGTIDPPARVLARRYLIIAALHQSAKGSVELAVDVRGARKCVLKRAPPGRHADLRHESNTITQLVGCDVPRQYDLFKHDGDLMLAMEYVEGQSFRQYVGDRIGRHEALPVERVVAFALSILGHLEAIRLQGFCYCDLKPDNIIVTGNSEVRLIDFEHATKIDGLEPRCPGTVGYASPQQLAGRVPTIQDTIYAFGAVMLFAYTGADPAAAPDVRLPLGRPLHLLRPGGSPSLESVLTRCLERSRTRRFRSLQEVGLALSSPSAERVRPLKKGDADRVSAADSAMPQHYRMLAAATIDALCARVGPSSDVPNWVGSFPPSARDGAGGLLGPFAVPVLALGEAYREFRGPHWLHALRQAVRSVEALRSSSWRDGLYAGDVGWAAALLRAGLAVGDEEWVAAAEQRGLFIASRTPESPDVVDGLAGHIRFLLLLSDAIKRGAVHIEAAIKGGDALLAAAETIDGGLRWWTPTSEGKRVYLGYAHGVAGIADVLLDLFEMTGYSRYLDAARDAGRWLASKARQVLFDMGIDFPATEHDQQMAPAWCHGAGGCIRFLLHLGRLDPTSNALELAQRAAWTTARGARGTFGASQCHGLAGSIEGLLDMYQSCAEVMYLTEARSLARLLEAFSRCEQRGLTWRGETPGRTTDDFLVGQSGIALCLLRLANPGQRPHIMTREGYRFGVEPYSTRV